MYKCTTLQCPLKWQKQVWARVCESLCVYMHPTFVFPSCHCFLALSWSVRSSEHLCFSSSEWILFFKIILYLWKCTHTHTHTFICLVCYFSCPTGFTFKTHQLWCVQYILWVFCWPAVEVLKGSTDRKSSPANLHSFQHPRVSQLVQDHIRIKLVGLLLMTNNKTPWKLQTPKCRFIPLKGQEY